MELIIDQCPFRVETGESVMWDNKYGYGQNDTVYTEIRGLGSYLNFSTSNKCQAEGRSSFRIVLWGVGGENVIII